MNGLNKYGYTNEHMSVNGGVVRNSEIPLVLLDHPQFGRMSLTADGTFYWLRSARVLPSTTQEELKAFGWWYSDKRGTGRKGWWTDASKNALAVDMLETLGFDDVPDITHNTSRKPEQSGKQQAKQQAHVAKAKAGRESRHDMAERVVAKAAAAQPAKSITLAEAVHPDGRTYKGVHMNKGGRWCDADGKLVPIAAIPEAYRTGQVERMPDLPVVKATKPAVVHAAPVVTPTVQPQVTSDKAATIKLLEQALAQQAQLIAALQAIV